MMKKIRWIPASLFLIVFMGPVLYVMVRSAEKGQYYELIVNNHSFFKYALKTIGYSLLSGALSTVLALPAGYIFAKVRFRFRNILFFIYILVMLLPFQATQLSGYLMFKRLSLLDSPLALILIMSFSPLSVFLLRQCISSMPDDVSDAFSLESRSVFKYLRYMVIPFAKPMLVTSFMLVFCSTYGMVEQAKIYMPKNIEDYPLSAVLGSVPEEGYYAGCTVYLLPVLLIYLTIEKSMRKGMEYYRWN